MKVIPCSWLVALIALALAVNAAAQNKALPENPSLKFQGLDGKVYDLAEQHGNVVLVSFGATWCAPCTAELRALNEVLNEYRGKPVKFFWVSIEGPAEATNSVLKRYARERRIAFPVLRDDARMVFLQFTDRVRLPMLVLVGKDGKVDAPIKFGMESQVESYKTQIRVRLNKLLLPSPDGRGTEGEGAKRATDRSTPRL
ncbi:MAG TPA: TlpA disulfide reductase family protein [Pyrinomonadaceae bacterium]|nr:TlpA disulfide reductase family protein [Pyrinomonadaceae bacterium]